MSFICFVFTSFLLVYEWNRLTWFDYDLLVGNNVANDDPVITRCLRVGCVATWLSLGASCGSDGSKFDVTATFFRWASNGLAVCTHFTHTRNYTQKRWMSRSMNLIEALFVSATCPNTTGICRSDTFDQSKRNHFVRGLCFVFISKIQWRFFVLQ